MNRSRVTGDLASHGNIFVDIANDRVGIGSTIPSAKLDVNGTSKFQDDVIAQKKLSFADSPYIGNTIPPNSLRFGDNDDFILYHTGSYSGIDERGGGTGGLVLHCTNNFTVKGNASNKKRIIAEEGGAVELYDNNELKLSTNYEGITVRDETSTQSMVKMNTSSGFAGALYGVGNSVIALLRANLQWGIKINSASSTELYHTGNAKKLETTTTGISVTGGAVLTSTDTGSSAEPELVLYRDSASPADADYLGQIKFNGRSDAGGQRTYAKITGKILDASNGTEDGILEFAHIKAGSQTITGRWRSDSLQLLNSTNFSVAGTSEFTGTATFSEALTLSKDTTDVINFSANSTSDKRGISFNSRTALSADYNDGFLRLNNESEFTNGVYTPGLMRADGGFKTDGNVVVNSSGFIVASRIAGALPALDGSNLTNVDAATLDGVDGANYVRTNQNTTITSDLFIGGGAGGITVNGGSDIRFTNGDWTGNVGSGTAKIQHHSNYLYIAGGSNGIIFRENNDNRWIIDGSGHFDPAADSTYDIGQSDKRVRNGYFDTLYGDGSNLTGITQTTINNNSNNRVITGSNTANTLEGESNLTFDGNTLDILAGSGDQKLIIRGTNPYIRWKEGSTDKAFMQWHSDGYLRIKNQEDSSVLRIKDNLQFSTDDSTFYSVWHAGNDGSGSGLNADVVDGIQGSSFLRSDATDTCSGQITHTNKVIIDHNSSTMLELKPQNSSPWVIGINRDDLDQSRVFVHNTNGLGWVFEHRPKFYNSGSYDNFLTTGDEGSGNGLDADTVDGIQGASFLRSDTADTASGDISFAGGAGAVTVSAGSDIRLDGGSWTGEYTGGIKIQPDASNAYFQYHGTLFFRNSGGANRFQVDSGGNATFTGSVTATGGFSGSGASLTSVNATTLDSIDSGSFLRSDADDSVSAYTNQIRFPSNSAIPTSSGSQASLECFNSTSGNDAFMAFHVGGDFACYFGLDGGINDIAVGGWSMGNVSNRVWHAGNDGSGSGLDADTLDGTHGGNMIRSGAQTAVTNWHISGYRNGQGTSPHFYFSHSGGYGMHINTYNTTSSVYALELHNNSKQLMVVYNNGECRHGGTTYPAANNSYDLGTTSARWRNIYTNDLNLSNEGGGGNDVDGTWGSYTIQEGEDDLFLINRRNGKKYKFNLTEVS